MFKLLTFLIAPLLIFFLVIISIFGAINVALRKNESNIDSDDVLALDPDAELDASYMDGTTMFFITSCYFPDSPDDPLGGDETCADGTRYWRDPNVPPERNLFAKTPDGRTIQGVVATVQDMHNPVIPWSLKDMVRLNIPCYSPAAEIHDHFATCVTDPRRLDLAMSGKEQAAKFTIDLAAQCPEAKTYRDPSGVRWNNGTMLPVTVTYLTDAFPNTDFEDLSPTRQLLVNLALAQQGKPYVWGAAGPNAFDCSGLVLWCYKQIGNSIPKTHNTNTQVREGLIIDRSLALPGDCVYFGSPSNYSHVGIYLGGDSYIHAPQTGDVVKISSLLKRNKMIFIRFLDSNKDQVPKEARTNDRSS